MRTPLIERNLRLVVYIARKFENTGIAMEDLVSIGTIGLIKAVNTFDPSKNIKLATYASRCIENEILMYLRRNAKTRAEVSFDEPLNTDWDGNELLLSDVIGVESDIVRRIEEEVDRDLLGMAMDRLSHREQRIVQAALRPEQRPRQNAKRSGGFARHLRSRTFPAWKSASCKSCAREMQRMEGTILNAFVRRRRLYDERRRKKGRNIQIVAVKGRQAPGRASPSGGRSRCRRNPSR